MDGTSFLSYADIPIIEPVPEEPIMAVMVADHQYTRAFRLEVDGEPVEVSYFTDTVQAGVCQLGAVPVSVKTVRPDQPPVRLEVSAEQIAIIRARLQPRAVKQRAR